MRRLTLLDFLSRLTSVGLMVLLAVMLLTGCDGDRVRREAAEAADGQSTIEGSISKSATKKATRWKQVLNVRAKKNAKTKTFEISGSEWKIRWKTKPRAGQENEEFVLVLYDKKNEAGSEIIANDIGEVDDFLYQDGKGEYYLEVSTNMPYELWVEERKLSTQATEAPVETTPIDDPTQTVTADETASAPEASVPKTEEFVATEKGAPAKAAETITAPAPSKTPAKTLKKGTAKSTKPASKSSTKSTTKAMTKSAGKSTVKKTDKTSK